MKKNNIYIIKVVKVLYLLPLCLLAFLFLTGCNSDNTSDLQLEGNCMVEALKLDSYEGNVDLKTRTITVRLPEVYETSAMKLTALQLSPGATCDVSEGATLNMDAPKTLHVKNGDVFIDWTLSVLHDEARITQFVLNDIYTGTIDQDAKTITAYVPASIGVESLVPTIIYSANATITPASGVPQDFTNPVTYKVTNNSAESTYTVTVHAIDKPKALFVGDAANMNDLDPEAKEACLWMLSNVSSSLYASFADLQAESVDLSECKVIWWHYHVDGGVDGHDAFAAKAKGALAAKNELRKFYENGGSLFLTRYATNLPSFIGATGSDEWTTPNNCWGQDEDKAELCGGPWTFRIFNGQNAHPLWQGLIAGDNADEVYCTDAGYHITNSTAQYHVGTDWGDYPDYNAWTTRTGAEVLGVGGDGAIVAWEYPATAGKGGIICIGSGCFDWYSYTFEAGYTENYHKNISTIAKNAFNYLTK
ncbi:DUF4960 domain-containing protein [Prevotella sp. KH2C16]|uniref:DUF4960 domain-containing protein n=1 Tax=Prevotella sp. KH2C16 TaxID=1855325 RepID=UPI000B87EEEF|nr:DUF4960 domain-containing protein [Prevotella sp. KH2C16]